MSYEPSNAMDRGYTPVKDIKPLDALEEPVLTLNQIGQTVPETDQISGRNMLQNVQAAIRGGAGTIQIVLNTSRKQALGGGPKATGKEVREALKEVALANNANIIGFELPTSAVTNLSGYDPQQRRIDKQAQKENLDEIRDALQFAADMGGGEVDLVSFEFPRAIYEQEWNPVIGKKKVIDSRTGQEKEIDQHMFEIPEEEKRDELRLVDVETGAIQALPRRRLPNPFFEFRGREEQFEKESLNLSEEELKQINLQRYIEWDDFLHKFKEQQFFKHKKDPRDPTGQKDNPVYLDKKDWNNPLKIREAAFNLVREELFERELSTARAAIARTQDFMERDKHNLEMAERTLRDLQDVEGARRRFQQEIQRQRRLGREAIAAQQELQLDEFEKIVASDEKKRELQINRNMFAQRVNDYLKEIEQQRQNVAENERRKNNARFFESYAREEAIEGYKKAGLIAYEEQKRHGGKLKHSLQIGPEIGWPVYFGGHPEEFKDIILSARRQMEHDLTERGVNPVEAKKAAKEHIKGIFDTGHMGMWLEHFKPHLPWEQRVKEFNTWYKEQVKELAKHDLISGVQAVDTATGAHAHLPPGQGILPIVESVKELKKQGFTGPVVSEGHEEEKFGQGRILFKAWQAFDPRLRTHYGAPPVPFSSIHNAYQGRGMYSPGYMVASVAPPFGEYRPWAGGDQPIAFE